MPFDAFYTGYRATRPRAPTSSSSPSRSRRIDGRQWWRKVGTRRAQAISKVMMAGVRGDAVRVALGAWRRPWCWRRRRQQALAAGRPVAEAQAALDREIAPIDDLRSTRDYRRAVARNLLARFWSDTA